MNSELLDSLLLDRELGELSPAVAALLDAHLAHDPAAARRAAEMSGTIELARRAIASPHGPPPQALDVARLRRAQSAAQSADRRTQVYRLAACLALGLGLGWFARPVPPPAGSSAEIALSVTRLAAAPAEPRSTFWSVARLAASQRPPAVPSSTSRHPLR